MKKEMREKFFNPDGSIKRLMEVKEVLPDGTRVFEDGSKASPSETERGGVRKRLDTMSPSEKKEWEQSLLITLGKEMSLYFTERERGA